MLALCFAFAPLSSARIAWSRKAPLSVRITACSILVGLGHKIDAFHASDLEQLKRRRWIRPRVRGTERHLLESGGRPDGVSYASLMDVIRPLWPYPARERVPQLERRRHDRP